MEGDGMMPDDPHAELKRHRLTPEMLADLAVVPQKIQKRRQQFVMVPWRWIDRLATTSSANTYRVALHLLHQHWKNNSRPFLLPNGLLVMEGVTRHSKWRALTGCEQSQQSNPYSITSSAVASSVGGTLRPSTWRSGR
jgi:hypothetical protein